MEILGVVLGMALAFLFFSVALLRWNEMRYMRAGLPPGTMGWPLVGETTEFLNQGPDFLRKQRARYGDLFRTHIFGSPTVVCMDPDLNRYILMNEGKGLLPGYPQSMLDLLGENNIAAVSGSLHKATRSAMLNLINPSMIKDRLLPKIDECIRSHISNWNEKVIDIQEKTKEMWLLSSLKQITSIESLSLCKVLQTQIHKLYVGTFSLPLNFPGTRYHQGLQARKDIVHILRQFIEDKRASPCSRDDIFYSLLNNDDATRTKLTDDQIVDMLLGLIYSGYETVSTTSMMAVKYLHDHPRALHELRHEHQEIRNKKLPNDAIDWNDYKSMYFTHAVILETLRIATVVNGLLRRTTHDIDLKGFTIPKGWTIYVYTREINYDSVLYKNPLTFNPWRWLNNNLEAHQYYMAFGGGSRLYPGKEWGLAEISVFLHYFVNSYRWEQVEGEELLIFPRVEAPNGIHIRVWDY